MLILSDPMDAARDQLFIDQVPVPRDAFRFDPHDHILSWRGLFGGGQYHLSVNRRSGSGVVGAGLNPAGIEATQVVSFVCDVATDCGAQYVTSGGKAEGFAWDPESAAWKGAQWAAGRLQLSYSLTPGGLMDPAAFGFEFADLQTGNDPWTPDESEAGGTLTMGERNGRLVWNLLFKSLVDPDADRGRSTSGPDTVYPLWLQAFEDASAMSISGAMQIDGHFPNGRLVGLQGVAALAQANGYFSIAPNAAPLAVFGGRLVIAGEPIRTSLLNGDVLSWSDLTASQQHQTGLPVRGSVKFAADGSTAASADGRLKMQRLSAKAALDAIAAHRDLHPQAFAAAERQHTALAGGLDIFGLTSMTPFVKQQGSWQDQVQVAVTQDLGAITNSFMPSDLWNTLFPGDQPKLTGKLAEIANSPVDGVFYPAGWYGSLAVAVLTQGLADGTDDNCKYLNKWRAKTWLKTQTAASKVYQVHGQALFQYEWDKLFPLTAQYRSDQINNASAYQPQIMAKLQEQIDDIVKNVADDPANPGMKGKLIAQMQDSGQYAVMHNLYWAFYFYIYNTSPRFLKSFYTQLNISSGSDDTTMLSRLLQANSSVLTALDPSGHFANEYVKAINTFVATNVMIGTYDFSNDSIDVDVVKQCLQKFVDDNLNNSDAKLAAAAATVQQILDDQQADEIFVQSFKVINSFAEAIDEAMALPFIAERYEKWFVATYPRFSVGVEVFGSLLLGTISGLAVASLVVSFKEWGRMTDDQRAQVIIDTAGLGLQFVAAVVQRGARLSLVFGADGLSAGERAMAFGRITVLGEGGKAFEVMFTRTGSGAARWLGSAKPIVVTGDGVASAILVSENAAAEDASLVGKMFGKNLEEFMGTRITPLLIIAGLYFNISSLIHDKGELETANDALGIASGGLLLISLMGTAAVGLGWMTAECGMAMFCSACGAFGILAALAGVGIMIYLLVHPDTPPDPVETFVNNYVEPAGFKIRNRCSSLDYARPFVNPEQSDLLMIGFTLASGDQLFRCRPDGTIDKALKFSGQPDMIWQASTDSLGVSKIFTVAQPDESRPPVVLYLSMMNDHTVSFQPKLSQPSNVLTQSWLHAAQSDAVCTNGGAYLLSLAMTLQPVMPDTSTPPSYPPQNATGWLSDNGSGLGFQPLFLRTTFTLAMSGMAPNFMTMKNLDFPLGTQPDKAQGFMPQFAVLPSAPLTCAVDGALPDFLDFDPTSGEFKPNGKAAATAGTSTLKLSVKNAVGQAQASFAITVAAPQPS
ncbi:hypothetical protein [Bradyrhizobium sp. S69]|uniref:hypothetical protein n=1 Tax=Bradyrhizobium sp. S69 TaxID=1641856 RepID=UPI00131DA971|nr:hypothetical protein [Bradyrhizobium sp. S69]